MKSLFRTVSTGSTKWVIYNPDLSNQILLPWESFNVEEHFTFSSLMCQKEICVCHVHLRSRVLFLPVNLRHAGVWQRFSKGLTVWGDGGAVIKDQKLTWWRGQKSWKVRARETPTCSVSDPPQLSPSLRGPPLRMAPGPLEQTNRML